MAFSDDESNPTDGYSIPSYPSNARAYRAMNKARWAVEHSETEGRHEFLIGTTATRDAVATWTDGAVFFNIEIVAGIAQQIYNAGLGGWLNVEPHAGIPRLSFRNLFTAAQYADPVAVTPSGGNIAISCLTSPFKTVTLNDNLTLANPSSDVSGKMTTITVLITQDGTGGRTLSFASDYRFPGNVPPVVAAGAGDITLLNLIKWANNRWLVLAALDIG